MKYILLSLLLSPAAFAHMANIEINFDRPGMDYRNYDLRYPDPSACRLACMRDVRCRAWTYVKPGIQGPRARCWLKNGVPPGHYNNCCTSGTKRYGTVSP